MNINYDDAKQAWLERMEQFSSASREDPWLNKKSLDAYRHFRMRFPLKFLINSDQTFLTLGDGRYGSDAQFIIEAGGNVHASDLDSTLLELAAGKGLINTYSAQNAEDLDFSDNSFDYVVIKEALHHFPRPYLALYESFRVCRLGVILIEPTDPPRKAIMRILKDIMNSFLRKKVRFQSDFGFEPAGNFVYTLSIRELQKFLLLRQQVFINIVVQ